MNTRYSERSIDFEVHIVIVMNNAAAEALACFESLSLLSRILGLHRDTNPIAELFMKNGILL